MMRHAFSAMRFALSIFSFTETYQMAKEIAATLPGIVSKLNIHLGDRLEEDEEVLVIEAFKMETPIFAPCNGTVKEIRVKAGDKVEENDVLVIIDEN